MTQAPEDYPEQRGNKNHYSSLRKECETLRTENTNLRAVMGEFVEALTVADRRLEELAYRDGKLNLGSVHRQQLIQKANQSNSKR